MREFIKKSEFLAYANSAIAVFSGVVVFHISLIVVLSMVYHDPANWPDPTGAIAWVIFALYLLGNILAIDSAGSWIADSIVPGEQQTGFFQDSRGE